jgi:hypothetical protein
MADTKISALSNAALPLAGTEVLPIVQSGSTVKVASDDLTVKNVRSNATTGILQVVGPATGTTRAMTTPNANFSVARIDAAQTFTGTQSIEGIVNVRSGNAIRFNNPTNGNFSQISNSSGGEMRLATGGGDALLLGGTGDATVSVGNLIIGTASKGVSLPGGITWTSGAGSPEGVVTAPVGSLYSRSDGGLLTSLYVKESGSGNTGWVGK